MGDLWPEVNAIGTWSIMASCNNNKIQLKLISDAAAATEYWSYHA
jgi:hypothetical protein